jgi:hypothetical protein
MLLGFLASFALIGICIILTTKDTRTIYLSLILLPAPVISLLSAPYLKHIWSFLALHLALIAVYSFTGANAFVTAFYILYLILLTIVAFNKRLKPDSPVKTNSSLLYLSVFVILYLVNHYVKLTNIDGLLLFLVTLFILLYLLNMYLINFEGYFRNNSNLSDIPIRQIKSTNHMLMTFFVGFCVLVMLFFTTLPLENLLTAAGGLLLILLRFVFSLFPNKSEEALPQESMQTEPAPPPFQFMDEGKSSVILDFIWNFILGLFVVALIAGAAALFIYTIYRIYKLFYDKKNISSRDSTEFISPFDKKEKLYKETDIKSYNRFFAAFSRSNNNRIRKLLFHSVKSHKKESQLTATLTPIQLSEYALTGQIGMSLDAPVKEKVTELAAYYELARYSAYECTKEDVLQVKNIIRKHQVNQSHQ